MTKARDIATLLSTANGKIAGNNLDVSFENITDTGTEGTKVATGTQAQRGTTQGQLRFNTDTGLAEYYNGTAFKSIDTPPVVSSLDVTEVDSQAGGNQTIVITGSNFGSGATVTFVGSSGTNFNASTVTVDSTTQITAVAPKASFLNAQEPYGVKVQNVSGLSNTLDSQINVDTAPTFDVASGSLGTLVNYDRASSNLTSVTATDIDGDTITFSKLSGTLPTGITFNSDGTFSGTADAETSDTTYTFTIRATANSKNSDRQYTITVNAPQADVFSYTGSDQTFTVPSGVSSFTAYVWGAAGGSVSSAYGGAGGFATGTISTSGQSSFRIMVGQCGIRQPYSSGLRYGFGGRGDSGGYGGSGGGLSGIFTDGTTSIPMTGGHSRACLIAGGGGGGAYPDSSNVLGGGGGGDVAQSGQSGTDAGATGGTQSGGGTNSIPIGSEAPNGFRGGSPGTQGDGGGGGSGGGGYYGGGAGSNNQPQGSAGGGGSGHAGHNLTSNSSTTRGDRTTVFNTSSTYYGNSAGDPTTGNATGHGRVVLVY